MKLLENAEVSVLNMSMILSILKFGPSCCLRDQTKILASCEWLTEIF